MAKILIVDDERTIVEMFKMLLDGSGHEVFTANSGTEAVSMFSEQHFDCVLSDKNMPDLDGLEVLQKARAMQPHCACILVTGYASTSAVVSALRLGANDFIEKPFTDVGILQQKIENAISNQRAHHQGQVLLERVRGYETEVDMFKELLELKLREANSDAVERTQRLCARVRTACVQLSELMLLANAASSNASPLFAAATCERMGETLEKLLVELELAIKH